MADTEQRREDLPEKPDTAQEKPPEEFKNAKEKLYDKIPLTVHQLDIIIVVLVILFVVFYVVGALRGHGIL